MLSSRVNKYKSSVYHVKTQNWQDLLSPPLCTHIQCYALYDFHENLSHSMNSLNGRHSFFRPAKTNWQYQFKHYFFEVMGA